VEPIIPLGRPFNWGAFLWQEKFKFVPIRAISVYNANFDPKKRLLRAENTYIWELSAV
jgi:hypothetical protein